jgi:uncharacterized protein
VSESSDAGLAGDGPLPSRASLKAGNSAPGGGAPDERFDDSPVESVVPRHRSWRSGGSSVRRWGWELAGWAVLGLGAGVVVAAAATQFVGGELGAVLSLAGLWIGMAVPVVLAFARSVPRGLLRFRPVDVLYGVVLGALLRLAQGGLETLASGPRPFPSYLVVDGALAPGWWFDDLIAPVLVAPVVEEAFFRGLVLVTVFVAVHRLSRDRVTAGMVAVAISAGLFVLAHAVLAPISWDAAVSLLLLGLVTGLLVSLTGRIWPALVTHVVYNGSYVVLALIGTFAG